jgi:hypothetical protein
VAEVLVIPTQNFALPPASPAPFVAPIAQSAAAAATDNIYGLISQPGACSECTLVVAANPQVDGAGNVFLNWTPLVTYSGSCFDLLSAYATVLDFYAWLMSQSGLTVAQAVATLLEAGDFTVLCENPIGPWCTQAQLSTPGAWVCNAAWGVACGGCDFWQAQAGDVGDPCDTTCYSWTTKNFQIQFLKPFNTPPPTPPPPACDPRPNCAINCCPDPPLPWPVPLGIPVFKGVMPDRNPVKRSAAVIDPFYLRPKIPLPFHPALTPEQVAQSCNCHGQADDENAEETEL